jgi:putative pyruvate formate lyase activating enzyme
MEGVGQVVSGEQLFQTARGLIAQGVHNLNFVSPDHFWPHIRTLARTLRYEGCELPFLYNCSGYQRPELIAEIAELMDIFLPDFKFADAALAQECMGDARYPEIALAALNEMIGAHGFLEPWDDDGSRLARRGVMVRHLVLPGEVSNSLRTLQLLYREFGRWLPISVMSQFTPMPACTTRSRFTRAVTAEEYALVCEEIQRLGFEQVYSQPCEATDDFVPDFRETQPFKGNG